MKSNFAIFLKTMTVMVIILLASPIGCMFSIFGLGSKNKSDLNSLPPQHVNQMCETLLMSLRIMFKDGEVERPKEHPVLNTDKVDEKMANKIFTQCNKKLISNFQLGCSINWSFRNDNECHTIVLKNFKELSNLKNKSLVKDIGAPLFSEVRKTCEGYFRDIKKTRLYECRLLIAGLKEVLRLGGITKFFDSKKEREEKIKDLAEGIALQCSQEYVKWEQIEEALIANYKDNNTQNDENKCYKEVYDAFHYFSSLEEKERGDAKSMKGVDLIYGIEDECLLIQQQKNNSSRQKKKVTFFDDK